jgi:hypothetical protein
MAYDHWIEAFETSSLAAVVAVVGSLMMKILKVKACLVEVKLVTKGSCDDKA